MQVEELLERKEYEAILGLGSNMGDRYGYLQNAIQCIANQIGKIKEVSPVYESKAWGKTNQNDFLNSVISVNTALSPLNLLKEVIGVEEQMGRIRSEKWGPRIIDIDILFYEDLIINFEHLKIPHPHILERKFVLLPLSDIKKNLIHPKTGSTVSESLESCLDKSSIWKFEVGNTI